MAVSGILLIAQDQIGSSEDPKQMENIVLLFHLFLGNKLRKRKPVISWSRTND